MNTTKATQIASHTLQAATRVSPDGSLAKGYTHIPLMETISELDQDIQAFLQMNKLSQQGNTPNIPLIKKPSLRSDEWEEEEELLLKGVKTYEDSTWDFISWKCFKGTRSAVQCHARCLYKLTSNVSFQKEASKIHRIGSEDA